MKKLNKVLLLVASVALTTAAAQASDNWNSGTKELVWKSPSEVCVRNNYWTEATAATECRKAAPVVVEAPAKVVKKPVIKTEKVAYAADAFFDFDKADLKEQGKTDLNSIVTLIKKIDLEAVVATGHTDSTGPAAYNQGLSERRADSVRSYLIAKGISADRIFVEGKGATEPVADNKTREGRSQNRRVEIEIVGTKQVKVHQH